MRKIEREMNAAIRDSRNWASGNTQVIYSPERDASYVMLHGNHIATILETSLEIYDGGYPSATTKSRLNAILSEFGMKGECVFQRNFKWFVHKFIGQAGTSPVYNEYEFTNGFVFA